MKCYLCKTPIKLFFQKNGYGIYRCPACGLAITDLQKDYAQFVGQHYTKGYFTGDPSRGAYVDYKDDKVYIAQNQKKFLQTIKKYKKGGRLLDVGCAMGYFVELAVAAGYDAYGFDPSEYAIEQAKAIVDIRRVRVGRIDTVDYASKSFDVITLFDVFEHLEDPLADMQRLRAFLSDDGIMVVATGDMESYAAKILGRRWTFYNPPQHLYFFTQGTMKKLLDRTGLVALEWFRIGKWLSLRYVLHLAASIAESRLAALLYGWVNKIGLGKIPLYIPLQDNMVAVIKKQAV